MIKCRLCDWSTTAGPRRSKSGTTRDGWQRLSRHVEHVHGVTPNFAALEGRGTYDDRDHVDPRDLPFTPEPGAPVTDSHRRAP